ncbi:glycosyltransferase family 4 protein [Apibacter raozihei]|uniref:glycosyltransferase family 4 protein n=1 Tax=Apibacter raozihei TaxID=2500547 RepID=UPI000FE39A6C|nr:glycosyltransferase family 4 protein [Apibacter raozihei]
MKDGKEKIAIVVQRFGKEINGGAEQHASLLVNHLKEKYEVEVLTSCAYEYFNWKNYYNEGKESIDDIDVLRFKTNNKNKGKIEKHARYLYKNLKYLKYKVNLLNFLYVAIKRFQYRYNNKIFDQWLEEQGPCTSGLVDYLKNNKEKYKAVIFFTYLYYPTNFGIREVSEKSILIPTAHDELPFYYTGFKKLFSRPKFIMYNTLSEKNMVEKTYPQSKKIKSDIAGVGFKNIIFNPNSTWAIPEFRYFVYIGRIDSGKGCDVLIENFKNLKGRDFKLVMIGENFMKEKSHNNVIFTGFISEEEKWNYLKNSEALIIPSLYESLSMVTLEAMSIGIPVLANAKCEVLKDHIINSKAGFAYTNFEDFKLYIKKILSLSQNEKITLGENGKKYVNENYQWEIIIDKFIKAINEVSSK